MSTGHYRTSKRQKTTASLPCPSSDAAPRRLSDLNDATPLDQVLAISQTNADRWEEIQSIQQEIENYEALIRSCKSKIEQLKLEHKRATSPTLLMTHPKEWGSLGDSRFETENIIAVLQSSSGLPVELYGDDARAIVRKVIKDRDVYLAVLDRDDFCAFFKCFGVPFRYILRTDKKVMLKLVQRFPEYLEEDDAPEELYDDPDVFLSFLRGASIKEGFGRKVNKILRRFSPRIRANESLVIKLILSLCNGNALCNGYGIFDPSTDVEPTFTSDSPLLKSNTFCLSLATAVLQVKNQHHRRSCPIMLRDLTSKLRGDEEVVSAFCRVNGRNLAYASSQLRSCSQVVTIACQENPRSVIYARPCQKKAELLSSKEFVMLAVADWGSKFTKLSCRIFDVLPLEMLQDRDIAVAASVASLCVLDRIKDAWLHDRQFWWRVLQGYRRCFRTCWYHLPSYTQQDQLTVLYVARHAGCDDKFLILDLVKRFPLLMSDREVIRNIVVSMDHERWPNLFQFTPSHVFEDRSLCIELLRLDGYFYERVPMHLRGDREVVEATLCNTPHRLESIPDHIQILYPDLIAAAIRVCHLGFDVVAEDLWFHRDVALAIISGGFQFEGESFRRHFSGDEEIHLAVAEHNTFEFLRDYGSQTFLADKQFMLKAVQKNGELIKLANDNIRFDFDLMLAAFAHERDLAHYLRETDEEVGGEAPPVAAFACELHERLHDYLAFMMVLRGISLDSPLSECLCPLSCHLPLLNQGSETAVGYKRVIAEFCGIPIGDELRTMKRVAVDLARWGF